MRALLFAIFLLLSASAGAITLADAVDRVRVETEGEILSATTLKEEGKQVHRIKVLLPNGRVRIVKIPKDEKA